MVYGVCYRQRTGQRRATDANCLPATATSSYAGANSSAMSCTMDATADASSDAPHEHDAFHAASAGSASDANCPTAVCHDACGSGRLQKGDERADQVEQDHEGGQERGSSITGIPVIGCNRTKESRQRKHQQPPGRGEGTWKSKRSAHGGGKLAHAAVVAMACISSSLCDKVEGIHCTVSSIRDCLPTSNAECYIESEESPKESRPCQKTCRCSWQGRRATGDLRRRLRPDMQDETEVPRDENAQRISEGLHQVVTSLSSLSESAEKLEPKSKRPRTKEEEEAPPGSRAMQPFGMADAS